jgi:hypothetical protein
VGHDGRVSAEFEVRLATRADEPDIRALVGSVPMPGDVAIRFAREPDYFLGATIMGDPCDVVVGRRRADGQLVGLACRAEQGAYVGGAPARVCYVGQIRIAEGARGRGLVARGARLLRERTPKGMLAFGVIARENRRAAGALVGARRLPGGLRAAHVAGLTTCAIVLWGRGRTVGGATPRAADGGGVDIRRADATTLDHALTFWRTHGPRRQFFPLTTRADFDGGEALRGLHPEDVFLAWHGDRVVGTMALWEQSAYKQDVVHAYGPALRRLRPAYDLAARLLGARPLTPPGEAIALAFAARVCVADDDPGVMRALLRAVTAEAHARGLAYLMVGLADDDPLLPVVRRHPHITYRSDLFALSWTDDPLARLDGRVPYVEIATL